MKTASYRLKILIFGMSIMLGLSAQAQPEKFVEGIHYYALVGSTDKNPENQSVMEVFSYGCPHCYAFEPVLHAWEGSLPDDVSFVRNPVIWNTSTKHYAQLYFVAEALGITSDIHENIFEEIHKNGNYLQEKEDIKNFFMAHGINGDDFDRAYKSFNVNSALRKAESSQKALNLTGIPSMIVNNKYLIKNDALKNYQEVLEVVSYLLQKDKT